MSPNKNSWLKKFLRCSNPWSLPGLGETEPTSPTWKRTRELTSPSDSEERTPSQLHSDASKSLQQPSRSFSWQSKPFLKTSRVNPSVNNPFVPWIWTIQRRSTLTADFMEPLSTLKLKNVTNSFISRCCVFYNPLQNRQILTTHLFCCNQLSKTIKNPPHSTIVLLQLVLQNKQKPPLNRIVLLQAALLNSVWLQTAFKSPTVLHYRIWFFLACVTHLHQCQTTMIFLRVFLCVTSLHQCQTNNILKQKDFSSCVCVYHKFTTMSNKQ